MKSSLKGFELKPHKEIEKEIIEEIKKNLKCDEDTTKFVYRALAYPGGGYSVTFHDLKIFSNASEVKHKIFKFETIEEVIKFLKNNKFGKLSFGIFVPNFKNDLPFTIKEIYKVLSEGEKVLGLIDYRHTSHCYEGTRFENLDGKYHLHVFYVETSKARYINKLLHSIFRFIIEKITKKS